MSKETYFYISGLITHDDNTNGQSKENLTAQKELDDLYKSQKVNNKNKVKQTK